MDLEWEIYLFTGTFQFSFVFTIFLHLMCKALDFLHGMMFFSFCLFVVLTYKLLILTSLYAPIFLGTI